jgi:hypothetical protein
LTSPTIREYYFLNTQGYVYNQKNFIFSEEDANVTATIGKNGELKEFEIAVTFVFANRSVVVTFKVYNIVQIGFSSDLDEYAAISMQTEEEHYGGPYETVS